jgi:hypothetical protein
MDNEKGRKMEEEKNEGYPRPGGDFVAPGNNEITNKNHVLYSTVKPILQFF